MVPMRPRSVVLAVSLRRAPSQTRFAHDTVDVVEVLKEVRLAMATDPNQDPAAVYQQLSPEQRQAIAQQFINEYQQSGHPAAQQFAALDPNAVSSQQLADMHEEARKSHPNVLGKVMQHPVATAAIGGFAAYEIAKHLGGKD